MTIIEFINNGFGDWYPTGGDAEDGDYVPLEEAREIEAERDKIRDALTVAHQEIATLKAEVEAMKARLYWIAASGDVSCEAIDNAMDAKP